MGLLASPDQTAHSRGSSGPFRSRLVSREAGNIWGVESPESGFGDHEHLPDNAGLSCQQRQSARTAGQVSGAPETHAPHVLAIMHYASSTKTARDTPAVELPARTPTRASNQRSPTSGELALGFMGSSVSSGTSEEPFLAASVWTYGSSLPSAIWKIISGFYRRQDGTDMNIHVRAPSPGVQGLSRTYHRSSLVRSGLLGW